MNTDVTRETTAKRANASKLPALLLVCASCVSAGAFDLFSSKAYRSIEGHVTHVDKDGHPIIRVTVKTDSDTVRIPVPAGVWQRISVGQSLGRAAWSRDFIVGGNLHVEVTWLEYFFFLRLWLIVLAAMLGLTLAWEIANAIHRRRLRG